VPEDVGPEGIDSRLRVGLLPLLGKCPANDAFGVAIPLENAKVGPAEERGDRREAGAVEVEGIPGVAGAGEADSATFLLGGLGWRWCSGRRASGSLSAGLGGGGFSAAVVVIVVAAADEAESGSAKTRRSCPPRATCGGRGPDGPSCESSSYRCLTLLGDPPLPECAIYRSDRLLSRGVYAQAGMCGRPNRGKFWPRSKKVE
jgi:hypothetical protein